MNDREVDIAKTLAVLVFEVKGINKRLDTANGSMQKHFESDANWMDAHNTVHVQSTSFAAGRASVRKGDMALLLAAVTVVNVLVNVAARFLG